MQDAGQRIVDFVSHSGRQSPDGHHLFRLNHHLLNPDLFGDIVDPDDGSTIKSVQGPIESSLSLMGASTDGENIWHVGQVYPWGGDRDGRAFLVDVGAAKWLQETPGSGTVPAFGSTNVTLSLSGAKAGLGTHQATIHVTSNDPSEPTVRIQREHHVDFLALIGLPLRIIR